MRTKGAEKGIGVRIKGIETLMRRVEMLAGKRDREFILARIMRFGECIDFAVVGFQS